MKLTFFITILVQILLIENILGKRPNCKIYQNQRTKALNNWKNCRQDLKNEKLAVENDIKSLRNESEECNKKLKKCTDGSKRKSMALSLPLSDNTITRNYNSGRRLERRYKNCKTIKRQRDEILTYWRQCVKRRDDIKINGEIDKKILINNLENCKSKLNECNTTRSNPTISSGTSITKTTSSSNVNTFTTPEAFESTSTSTSTT